MFSMTPSDKRRDQSAAYASIGLETGVPNASPHRLILMLFDGALLAIAKAGKAMDERQIAEKGQEISRAIDIISCGLRASLDFTAGDDLPYRLAALYDYFCNRLLHANLNNDRGALREVAGLLSEIKTAWAELADDPAVASRNKSAA